MKKFPSIKVTLGDVEGLHSLLSALHKELVESNVIIPARLSYALRKNTIICNRAMTSCGRDKFELLAEGYAKLDEMGNPIFIESEGGVTIDWVGEDSEQAFSDRIAQLLKKEVSLEVYRYPEVTDALLEQLDGLSESILDKLYALLEWTEDQLQAQDESKQEDVNKAQQQ